MRIRNDLATVFEDAVEGRLQPHAIDWDPRTALGVVVAAHNYPATPRTGDVISQLPADTAHCVTFHAGTTLRDGQLYTDGGRVLCVTGLADTVEAARTMVYDAVQQVQLDGMQYRTDIAWRALQASA